MSRDYVEDALDLQRADLDPELFAEEATAGVQMMILPSIRNTSKHFFLVPPLRHKRARDLNTTGVGCSISSHQNRVGAGVNTFSARPCPRNEQLQRNGVSIHD